MGKTLFGALANTARTLVNQTPVSFAPPGHGRGLGLGLARPAGQEAQMRAMGSNSTLFAIVDRITTAYAAAEWHLYRKAPSGKDEDRVEVMAHAALDLWNRPNEFMSGPAFREAAQQHEELVGEQWWVIGRREGFPFPLELWPVRPDRMEPIPDANDFVVGYVYRSPSGERVPLAVDDVLFLRRPNPMDPYRGMGAVQTILTDLDATRASAEWNAVFFRNSAEPAGVVEVDARLSDAEFNEFNDRWAEQHRGVSNAHRVAVLDKGLKWRDRSYSMRDMEFTELRSMSREIIREAFGFPKPMLGGVDDVNRANADAAEYVFARWLITPRLDRVREILNTRLLPMYGPTAKGLEFDYTSPVPEDVEADARVLASRAQAAQSLRSAGWYADDVATAAGLPAMEARDPQQQILVDIVRGAPSTAPFILPLLGFDIPALPAAPAPAPAAAPTNRLPAAVEGEGPAAAGEDLDNAMRWVVVTHDDDNRCKPCADNDGHLYRNRADAYADYPGGTGYIHCVGAEHGNDCRCKVVKRRKGNDGEEAS